MKKVPSHYRQLKPNEYALKGDVVIGKDGKIAKMHNNALSKVSFYPSFKFFRRRHVKVKGVVVPPVVPSNPKKETVVEFQYPNSKFPNYDQDRTVVLISMDEQYLTGLERTFDKEKYKYQFKYFRRDKIVDGRVNLKQYFK